MSWQAYTDNLKDSGNVTKGAIIGLDGSVWAQSSDLQLSSLDIDEIVRGYKSQWCDARQKGVTICGEKYLFLTGDDCQFQAKKGTSGISCAKAKTCIVLGFYKEGIQPGACRNAIEKMADYLRDKSY